MKNTMHDTITHLAKHLGKLLTKEQAQVTTAESCTGGGIAEAITRISGSSSWFEAGYVTYSNKQKTAMLAVPSDLFTTVGAVSEEVVKAMVQGAIANSGAQYGVAVSGVAGPTGGTERHPVGMVWLAWYADGQCYTHCAQFNGDRASVREQTVQLALHGLIRLLQQKSPVES